MTAILTILVRLVVMLLGFVASCLAASAFLHVLWLGPFVQLPGLSDLLYSSSLFVTVPMVAMVIGGFTFFQTIIVLAIAELTGRRSWIFYVIAGAVIALPIVGMFWIAVSKADATLEFINASITAAGMVGSFVYWLVAGRTAGLWRDPAPSGPGPQRS